MRAETEQQSEFNMAVSYLRRLDTLFYEADEASINLNPHRWYYVLKTIHRELSTWMKPDESKEWLDKAKGINIKITRYLQLKETRGINQVKPDLMDDLETYELYLREVLQGSGLQTKLIDDARRALG